jgi:hypothetical protein
VPFHGAVLFEQFLLEFQFIFSLNQIQYLKILPQH